MRKQHLFALVALTVAAPAIMGFSKAKSGLPVGEFAPAFEPVHVTGPDKKTNTCPVCKYGVLPAVQVWVNTDSAENLGKIASTIEKSISTHGPDNLKGFVMFMNPKGESKASLEKKLSGIAGKYKLKNVALTYVSGPKDEAVGLYDINTSPDVKNTVLVYSGRKISHNFVNLGSDATSLSKLSAALKSAASKR